MKKFFFFAAVAVMALATVSCHKGYKADLRTDVDTISYYFGVGTGSQMKQTLAQQGIDTIYFEDLIDGIRDGIKAANSEEKKAYYMGMMIGLQSAEQVNEGVFSGSKDYKLSQPNFMAGLTDGAKQNFKIFDPNKDFQKFQEKAMMIQGKVNEEIKKTNEEYVKEYAKDKGVKKLESGTLYKVLKEGKGELATDSSQVYFHYEGKTIDGKVFDSNMGADPAIATPKQLVPGMGDALKHMPAGSKWEVCIPWDKGYGEQGQGRKIKPYSTLIFTVEVDKIEAAKPMAQPGMPVDAKAVQQ